MKNIGLLLLLIFACSCKNIHKSENKKVSPENFEWLIGNWQRTNEEPNIRTFEYWKKINDSEYIGLGLSLQDADTLFKENIKLIKSVSNWNLEVVTKEDASPTVFKVTKIDENGFTCENRLNEFPKIIHYFKNGDLLEAVISGDNQEIPFQFERVK